MRLRPKNRVHGSSVFQLSVAVAVVLALAAVVSPVVGRELDRAAREQALADCSTIARALRSLQRDVGCAPCGFRGAPSYGWLRGPGKPSAFAVPPDGLPGSLSWFVTEDYMGGGRSWRGPYLAEVPVDPWGRQYVVTVDGYWSRGQDRGAPASVPTAGPARRRIWVLSAGPDGIIETRSTFQAVAGDDIGVLLE